MNKLGNYITGKWISGEGDGQVLHDAVTGDEIAVASTEGLDFASILDYGRRVGNPGLRKMTFHERGRMLRALAVYLNERKEKFYVIILSLKIMLKRVLYNLAYPKLAFN